ncbi:gamma-tubulin complex component 2 [Cinnamomum micranthum f. kanehirae]|uniref:Gamma-tubulin complex component n=1 Tax=Cinnamomum micranthum f. kanehirae TaxID=337451 RepID=A0A3S3MWH0_9MAGN|nr:gamma-tubulin complex component 2 [Cinnamomum micranthum f. kanehirae]
MDSASRLPFQLLDGTSNAHFSLNDSTRWSLQNPIGSYPTSVQGDFLVHFMDIAQDELVKSPDDISVEKLQSLLELAQRTTAAAADPCHEKLKCCVTNTAIAESVMNFEKEFDAELQSLGPILSTSSQAEPYLTP